MEGIRIELLRVAGPIHSVQGDTPLNGGEFLPGLLAGRAVIANDPHDCRHSVGAQPGHTVSGVGKPAVRPTFPRGTQPRKERYGIVIESVAGLFLSYNSADRDAVQGVRNILEAHGVSVFFDQNTLVPGLPWPDALENALRKATGVVVFVGSELGRWQKREMYFALDRQVAEERAGKRFPLFPHCFQTLI